MSTPATELSDVEDIAQLKFTATRIFEEQDGIVRAETGVGVPTGGTDELLNLPQLPDKEAVIAARTRLLEQSPSSIAERKALAEEANGILLALRSTIIPSLRLTDEEFIKKRCLVLRAQHEALNPSQTLPQQVEAED